MKGRTARLGLLLVGPPIVELDGRSIKLETKKALALLAYLSMCPPGMRRESLAALFWPEYDQTHSSGSLRRTLSSLNRSLPGGWLEIERETACLASGTAVFQDVSSFRSGLSRCRAHCGGDGPPCAACLRVLETAVALYRGDFLDGLNLKDCPDFDEWQRTWRESLRADLGRMLERLAEGYAEAEQWDRAISHARRWISLDRMNEPAQRRLMDLLVRTGQKSAAIQQYEDFARLLDDELGTRPEAETDALYDAALSGKGGPRKSQPAPPVPSAQPIRPEPEPFLRTKLFIPPIRADSLKRSRLTDRLDRATQKPLTLVSAPAGFGKTTLLCGWAARAKLPVAWVSLDSADNEPGRLLRAVITALRTAQPGLSDEALGMSSSAPPVPAQAILTVLLNEMAGVPGDTALVFDDFHVLQEPSAREAASFLLGHLPPGLHLVIATRSDPMLPVALMRARGQLEEIRAEDLRFTFGEASELINTIKGLNVPAEDVRALQTRTEGWIAGLQLAALSMEGRQDRSGFIAGFSGGNRFVLDYLTDEVLNRQPDDIQRFLLHTSILDRLCGALCDAVTGRTGDSTRVLEDLERANLFLVPLDDSRRWYRYHHLFRDILHARLAATDASRPGDLHLRAAEWFEENGFLEEAIFHAHAAGDHERMVRIIETAAPSYVGNARQTVLADWIALLPHAVRADRPHLSVLHAWGHVTRARMGAAEPLLDEAEKRLAAQGGENASLDLRGTIAGLRAQIAETRGDVTAAIHCARLALEQLAPQSMAARVSASYVLGRAYFTTADFPNARRVLSELVRAGVQTGTFFLYCPCAGILAGMLRIEGKLREAELAYREMIRVMRERGVQRFFIGGNPFVGLGTILRERNELEEAEQAVDEGIAHNRQWGNLNAVANGLTVRARVLVVRGRLDEAAGVLREAGEMVHDFEPYPDVRSALILALIELHLARGDLGNALGVVENYRSAGADKRILWREHDEISFSRVSIAAGRSEEALGTLTRLEKDAACGGRVGRVLEIRALQALALQATGRTIDALAALRSSIEMAASEGFARTFLDLGEPMRRLFAELRENGRDTTAGYVGRLMAAFPS